MRKIGYSKYVKDAPLQGIKEADYTKPNLVRRYQREKHVYQSLLKNIKLYNLNDMELWHAKAYFYEIEMSLTEKGIKIPR